MSEQQSMVVVVLGSTGTGKSKLAIELAKKFNGEIISADSMQVYHGLDIVTNKVTLEEQASAPHHLINCVDPLSRFTVVDFRNRAIPIIEQILNKKKLPIIVGGTNYYIESLIWEVLIQSQLPANKLLFDSDAESDIENGKEFSGHELNCQNIENIDIDLLFKQKITQKCLKKVPSVVLHQALKEVDPCMADTLHPQDKRKIVRSLQVYQQHGQCHSRLLQNQRNQDGGSALGGPLRFKKSIMFWLQCDKPVLDVRLDDRVDEMLEKGLVNELLDFHKIYNEQRLNEKTSSYEEGIFQSIGFKEFHEYLILSDEEKSSDDGKKIFEKAIEDMKLVTRQYARKQTKWVINRFLRRPKRQLPPVYGLDATDLNHWAKNVLDPAVNILQSLIKNKTPPVSPMPIREELEDIPETHYCEVCERIFVGRRIWKIHLSSKKHQKVQAGLKKRKRKENEE